jgi:sec-independent protein translocase protein TatA
MFGLGLPEIMVILVVVVVFFFGGEKIEEIARNLGRFTGEFKKGKAEFENEISGVRSELGEIEKIINIQTQLPQEPPPESPPQPPPPPPHSRHRR